jgi:hypothetical protein
MKRLIFSLANHKAIGSAVDSVMRVVKVASQVPEYAREVLSDRAREVRIRDLRLRMQVSYNARDHLSVAHLGRKLFAECDARSARQCARMTRRRIAAMDEHMREALGK